MGHEPLQARVGHGHLIPTKDLVNKTRRVMMCFGRFLSLRQGGSRRQSESPRCLITNFRSGIGPDQSEWLALQSNVSVGLILWTAFGVV